MEKVEMEAPNGEEIRTTVHFASVTSPAAAKVLAARVNTAALDRIAFNRSIAIENARITSEQLSDLNSQPGVISIRAGEYMLIGNAARLVVGITTPDQLKTELEMVSPPGEQNYGLLRSARQSQSAAEEFMHLYHILLMICNDS
ncbi:MAG TPA: hypothetical protein VED59_00310 [Acidimicrobiales bacterium]|nr:hypothetical protein [Acidimicrobiales bacterium]